MNHNRLFVAVLCVLTPIAAAAVDLATAYAAARAYSADLRAAHAVIDSAKEGTNMARAQLLPQVALQINQSELRQTTTRTTGKDSYSGGAYNHELSFRQSLVREKARFDLQISRVQVEVAGLELEKIQSHLWQRIASVWVDACVSDLKESALSHTADAASILAVSAQKRFEQGESTRDAVAEARARARLAQSRLSEARSDNAIALHTLEALTGSTLRPSIVGKGTTGMTGWRAFDMPTAAYVLENNPALKVLQRGETVAMRRIAKAESEHLPTVDLVASVTRSENDNNSSLGVHSRASRIGLQASIPLSAGGGVIAQVRQARNDAQAAKLRREAAEIETRLRIETALQRHQALVQRREAIVDQLQSAQLLLESARRNAAAGQKSFDGVFDAQEILANRIADTYSISDQLLKLEIQVLGNLPASDPIVLRWSEHLERRLVRVDLRALSSGTTP